MRSTALVCVRVHPRTASRRPARRVRSGLPSPARRRVRRRSAVAAAPLAPAAPAAAAPALGEVAQQLARQRARACAPCASGRRRAPAAASGVWARRRGQQRRRQAAVLLARGLHEPARVARVGRAGGVHEQPEQALGLRPALHGVLLVHLAAVLGQVPEPARGLVAAADLPLGQRLEQHLHALAALVARPAAHDLHRLVEGLRVAQVADLARARAGAAGSCGCAAGR